MSSRALWAYLLYLLNYQSPKTSKLLTSMKLPRHGLEKQGIERYSYFILLIKISFCYFLSQDLILLMVRIKINLWLENLKRSIQVTGGQLSPRQLIDSSHLQAPHIQPIKSLNQSINKKRPRQ